MAAPAEDLVNLEKAPVAVVTGETSYHIAYDHLTVRYFEGGREVSVKHVRLENRGICWNGHMRMLERNSDEIVVVVRELALENMKPKANL